MLVPLISVKRINGQKLIVNADLIEFLESTPDTLITLTSGKKIMVKETRDEIVSKVIDYRRLVSKGIDRRDENISP